MRALRILAIALCAITIAAAAPAAHHENLMAEVTAFGDAVEKAMLENDFETMIAMYTEDAISLPNYGPRMEGIEAFRQHHEQMSAAGMKVNSFSSTPTDVWVAGDQVIEIGTFEIALEMPGMPHEVEDRGKYMTVYVRDADGALKIKAETWNTDINPMAHMGGAAGPEQGHEHGHDHHGDMKKEKGKDMESGAEDKAGTDYGDG